MKVSRIMSTQHPDNVRPPFFSDRIVLEGDDEIREAFYAYSHLNIEEQLWDCEGKETDNYVVKKLLSRYEPFFSKKRLGKDIFLTYRVPNPRVESGEGKILLETLESIPRSFDMARLFYHDDIAPVFEVCLPMTESPGGLIRMARYYQKIVVGKQHMRFADKDISIAEWIGKFMPEKIRVTPLIEEKEAMLNAHRIAHAYIKAEKIEQFQRVWLARSDPALNYGSLAAVLIEKIALMDLWKLQEKTSVDILPILGCGSTPFRGNFKPQNVDAMLSEYPSVQTFTVQSAFKYDNAEQEVLEGIEQVKGRRRKPPADVDRQALLSIIDRTSEQYFKEVSLLADRINDFSSFIPRRRLRKLHIGLLGYSRQTKGLKLPRAIKFCASLYSMGFPPEMLGLSALKKKDLATIEQAYPGFLIDLRDAMQYFNKDNMRYLPKEMRRAASFAQDLVKVPANPKHNKITSIIMDDLAKGRIRVLEENITRAGWIRGFLG
ncbi:MAG: phosphoenolpyruvate carboxylase [DPANN group archaeon]|nr:phosphoenolpyruvate carboxylase [DPANN group archaeon]